MALQFTGQSVFVALGKSRKAVFFSLLRKAFIVVPLTLLLPRIGMGVDGVFWAEPISNLLGGSACFLTMLGTVLPELKRRVETNDKKSYFDVGDVLIEYRWREMLYDHGVTGAAAERIGPELFEARQWRELDAGEISVEEAIREYQALFPEDSEVIAWF